MSNSTMIQSQIIKILSLGDLVSIIGIILGIIGFILLLSKTTNLFEQKYDRMTYSQATEPKTKDKPIVWFIKYRERLAIIIIIAGMILGIVGILLK